MTSNLIRSAAFVLALGGGLGTSTAFAQVGYQAAPYAEAGYGRTSGNTDQQAVPYDRFGHFSCGYNELHTHLERKDCNETHYSD